MDDVTMLKFAIETYLLPDRDTAVSSVKSAASLQTNDMYGIVFTIWGTTMKALNAFGVHAGAALTKIIGDAGNIGTFDTTRVSRRRFSDEDCCVEISAVPIRQSRTSEFLSLIHI